LAHEITAGGRLFWCIAAGVLGSPDHAEDVVQEAAVIGLEKLASFEPGTSFNAWMGQIVRNVALNMARRRTRAAETGEGELTEQLPAPDAEPALAQTDAGALTDPAADHGEHFDDRVLGALRVLTDTARVCLLLRTVLELDYAEIARTLGIPEGTAMSHVHRSRLRMRSLLEGAD
jgi:RNA polymerase sigma-70 factor (ECF subfamily)